MPGEGDRAGRRPGRGGTCRPPASERPRPGARRAEVGAGAAACRALGQHGDDLPLLSGDEALELRLDAVERYTRAPSRRRTRPARHPPSRGRPSCAPGNRGYTGPDGHAVEVQETRSAWRDRSPVGLAPGRRRSRGPDFCRRPVRQSSRLGWAPGSLRSAPGAGRVPALADRSVFRVRALGVDIRAGPAGALDGRHPDVIATPKPAVLALNCRGVLQHPLDGPVAGRRRAGAPTAGARPRSPDRPARPSRGPTPPRRTGARALDVASVTPSTLPPTGMNVGQAANSISTARLFRSGTNTL